MHYFMFIQGSFSNSTFTWIHSYNNRNPTITSITVLFRPNCPKKNNFSITCSSIGNARMPVYARCRPRSNVCYPCKS